VEGGGRRKGGGKEEGGRRKKEGRRNEERGRRKEEGGRRKEGELTGFPLSPIQLNRIIVKRDNDLLASGLRDKIKTQNFCLRA
jgi:hypothetical protein